MVLFMAQLLDEILGELFLQLFLPNVLTSKVAKCTCLTWTSLEHSMGKKQIPHPKNPNISWGPNFTGPTAPGTIARGTGEVNFFGGSDDDRDDETRFFCPAKKGPTKTTQL